MVDLGDKVKDKLSGGSDDEGKSKKKKGKSSGKKKKRSKKKSGGGKSKGDDPIAQAVDDAADDAGPSRSSSADVADAEVQEDIEQLLLCLGNIIAYTEGAKLQLEQKSGRKAQERLHATENIYNEATTFMGIFNIQSVAEKHGFDWEEDVLKYIMQHQDIDEMVAKYNR